jgi:uncharacterized membrane protein YcaP (DUF421 family)
MKVVSIAGLIVVMLIVLSLAMLASGRIEFAEVRGFEYIIALLLLDAAQDASHRNDETLSTVASIGAVFTAVLTIL